jgi:DNA-directed RNA polymerase subunit alpha
VLHEFSSLAGVREDVTDIVLNVKQIALKMQAKAPSASAVGHRARRSHRRRHRVSGDIEVMNPDLVICHLDEGATLNMELTVDTARAMSRPTRTVPADAPIGLIPVDALYSPVRQVAYKVDNDPRRPGAGL